jgi:hypothetical protein
MPVPSLITDLSQTASSNYPQGSDSPSTLDDVQRAVSSFVAMLRDGKGFTNAVTIASATTTDIGGQNALSVEISGTTTITSFGTSYNGPRFIRFTGALTLTHSSTILILPTAANITTAAGDTAIAIPTQAGTGWAVISYTRASGAALTSPTDYLNTTRIDVASASTVDLTTNAPNTRHIRITGTTAITAFTIAVGLCYFVTFSGATTLTNGSGLVTQTGANILTAAGDTCIIRATAANTVEILSYSSVAAKPRTFPSVRQTVISGPVDSSGLPSFGGSTGSTTVTASGTLIATAANGFDVQGAYDLTGSITNPSWTGLSTNGTMYLYLDISSTGTATTGSTTLSPVYQSGGTYSTINNQFTFNTQEMVGKVGNGSTAAQTYRVFVGEVTVSGGVVTVITWYSLQGRYQIPLTAMTASNTAMSWSHNVGVIPREFQVRARCVVAANNNAVGDEFTVPLTTDPANGNLQPGLTINTKVVRFYFTTLYVADATTGSVVSLVSNTNYNWTGYVMRGW